MSAERGRIDVDGLKQQISIETLIEREGVELKRKGNRELVALCPFHTERTPSFTVTPAKQLYYCNGCGAGGDHIRFLMERHGLGFVDAAQRLQEIVGGAAPANDNVQPSRASKRSNPPPLKWVKAMPPERAPAPPAKLRVERNGAWIETPVVARWAYRTPAGDLVGYTCRIEFEKDDGTIGKDVIPLSWQTNVETGEAKWRQGAFGEPRPLYGAELLRERPDAAVVVVEGEKACDAGRRMVGDLGPVVVTWPGGCKAVDRADWSVLAGRNVVGWPDTDSQADKLTGQVRPYLQQPGMAAMLRIADILEGHGVEMLVTEIERPDVVADGWDAADAEAEGWDGETTMAFLAERSRTPGELRAAEIQRELDAAGDHDDHHDHDHVDPADLADHAEPPAPEAGDQEKPEPKKRERRPPPNPDSIDELPVRALGYRRGHYYYLSARQGQVHEYSAGAHGPTGLMQLAPLSFWAATFSHGDVMKREHWQFAVDALMRRCERAGIFDTELVRGRGCWIDNGRMVLNLGNRVLVDGVQTRREDIGGDYIYEADTKLPGPRGEPLTTAEAQRVIDIAKRFNWEMPASAALLAGWIVLAPICGALKWRPHIWISGGTGTGKTTILNQFVVALLGGMELKVQGNSTEAGIRQKLRADARPVLFDESEKNDDREAVRIDNVLSLIRQSSSDSEFKTLKGTTSGTSLEFHIRSMFCLASIQVGIKMQADHTRIAVLSLYGNSQVPPEQIDDHHAKWLETERMLAELRDDPEFGVRLVQRSVNMVEVIRANMRTLVRVAAAEFKSQRLGDTYGTLLAGVAALFYERAISDEAALSLIRRFEWSTFTEAAREDESNEALSGIMQIEVRVEVENGSYTATVGELVSAVAADSYNPDRPFGAKTAALHLGRLGVKVDPAALDRAGAVLIANKSDRLQRALRGKPWAEDWKSYLRRVRGAKSSTVSHRFSEGLVQRATIIPIEAALPRGG